MGTGGLTPYLVILLMAVSHGWRYVYSKGMFFKMNTLASNFMSVFTLRATT